MTKAADAPKITEADSLKIVQGFVIFAISAFFKWLTVQLFPFASEDVIQIISWTIAALVGIVLILLVYRKPRPWKWISAIVILIGVFLVLSYFLSSADTVYFIVDSSENMGAAFQVVQPFLTLRASDPAIPENVQIGLASMGGNLNGIQDCENVTLLVKPQIKGTAIDEIANKVALLGKMPLRGHADVQKSIEFALRELKNRRGLQKIFIITTKLDADCNHLDREKLDQLALQMGVSYQVEIYTVGTVSNLDSAAFEKFADKYAHLGDVNYLPVAMEAAFSTPVSPVKDNDLVMSKNAVVIYPGVLRVRTYPNVANTDNEINSLTTSDKVIATGWTNYINAVWYRVDIPSKGIQNAWISGRVYYNNKVYDVLQFSDGSTRPGNLIFISAEQIAYP